MVEIKFKLGFNDLTISAKFSFALITHTHTKRIEINCFFLFEEKTTLNNKIKLKDIYEEISFFCLRSNLFYFVGKRFTNRI